MIRIGAGIALFGAVALAFGIWTFRHYSMKKASTRHLELQSDIKKVDSTMTQGIEGIDMEFKNTIEEIQKQKNLISTKIEKETNSVIDELKLKSSKANNALEELKKQSDEASNVVSNEVNKLQEFTKKGISKLSYPLPNELRPIGLSITVNSDGIKKYLPELQQINKIDDSTLKRYREQKRSLTTGLGYANVSDEIMNMFEGKTITVIIDSGPLHAQNREFLWRFDAKISLKDNMTSSLHYRVDYAQEEPDNLDLQLSQIKKSEQSSLLRFYGGLSSALELCNKKVWIYIALDGTELEIPIISINRLSFKDNNSKDYSIIITGIETLYHEIPALPKANIPARTMGSTYVVGQINCLSF